LISLLVGPEDGGSAFLLEGGGLLSDYTALYPRRQYCIHKVKVELILTLIKHHAMKTYGGTEV
jgi:hypothetical protein